MNNTLYTDLGNTINIIESNNKQKGRQFIDKLIKKYNHIKYNNLGALFYYKEGVMLSYFIGVDCVIKEMSHTTTILKIGNTILTNIFLRERRLYIKDNDLKADQILESDKYFSYENFLRHFLIENDDILFIGDHFLNFLLGYPLQVFEKTFNHRNGLLLGEGASIKFSDKYIHDVNKTVIINPHSFPMLCQPNN